MTGRPLRSVLDLRPTKRDAASSSMQTSDAGCLRHDEHPAQQLLPGIPDDISLDLVCPKLPWKSFYILSAVSQGWKRAIRSGQVYDARIRAKGTETLGVIYNSKRGGSTWNLCLYSGKDKLVLELPLIPNVRNGIPELSRCVSGDGKIYVVGRLRAHASGLLFSSDDVYMLDLARQRPWEQCKSMGYARINFGVGVVGGKIYVLGGLLRAGKAHRQAVTVAEVYDPLYNTWSPFESMIQWRAFHEVLTIGEDLVIHNGYFSPKNETKKDFIIEHDRNRNDLRRANFSEIYHPGKNAWRKLRPFGKKNLFILEGRLHSMTPQAIDVYDIDKESWTSWYSYSHAGGSSTALLAGHMLFAQSLDPTDEYGQDIRYLDLSVMVLGNEVVAAVYWGGKYGVSQQTVVCIIVFGTKQETIQLRKVKCPFEMTSIAKICSLEL